MQRPFSFGLRPFLRRGWTLVLSFAATVVALPSLSLPAMVFVRGDATGDELVDLSDPISVLSHLFERGNPLVCSDAADQDDSGVVDLSDPVGMLGFLFLGGAPPSPPFPLSGMDLSPDGLSCSGEPDTVPVDPIPPMTEFADDVTSLRSRTAAAAFSHTSPQPIWVSGQVFGRLFAAQAGESVDAALGEHAGGFLSQFYGGMDPASDGPTAVAADLVAPMGSDGCFVIPPELLDGGSHDNDLPGHFVRGDVDGDGAVGASDATTLLECLQEGICPSSCPDAGDANDDGRIDFSDVGAIVDAWHGETTLPPPGPGNCGGDETSDELSECSRGVCGEPNRPTTLEVDPPQVCGLGRHLVTLIVTDSDGSKDRTRAWVELCFEGEGPCAAGPLPRKTFGGDETTTGICQWIIAVIEDPEATETEMNQTSYDSAGSVSSRRDRPPFDASGSAMEMWRTDLGAGPDHFMTASRHGANCLTPPSDLSLPGNAKVQVRIGAFCLRGNRSLVIVECQGDVEVEGMYASKGEAGTSAGVQCPDGANSVECLVEDEVALQANDALMFSKSMSAQNGNSITMTSGVSGQFGVTTGGPGGAAANVAVNFGSSQSISGSTGRDKEEINAFANKKTDLPVTIDLSTKCKVALRAVGRTSARARVEMQTAAFWLVAKTSCPLSPLFYSRFYGSDTTSAKTAAAHFRLTRLGH